MIPINMRRKIIAFRSLFMRKARIFRILILLIFSLNVVSSVLVITIVNDPVIGFVLEQSGYLTPDGFTRTEDKIRFEDEREIPVMVYRSTERKTDLYYFLVHGFAPKAHRHEKIDNMAASLCSATGMNVIVPMIPAFFQKGATSQQVSSELALIYTAACKKYPGRYRTFAACLGSTILLMGLKEVKEKYLPEKIFLYGSLYDGTVLLKKMQKQGAEIDFIVKLVMAARSQMFNEKEKELIHKALMATEPGPTDESRMRQILGEKLYGNMSILRFSKNDIRELDPAISGNIEKYSKSKIFILNPRSDRIIPFGEGKKLAKVLRKKGAEVNFLGTGLFGHTENRITAKGIIEEFRYMYRFFSELFEGDLE